MKTALTTFAAVAFLASEAGAAPINPADIGTSEVSNVEHVRIVCNKQGRCWRVHKPYYTQRSYYSEPGYYDRRAYGYYGGPSIGLSFGRW